MPYYAKNILCYCNVSDKSLQVSYSFLHTVRSVLSTIKLNKTNMVGGVGKFGYLPLAKKPRETK